MSYYGHFASFYDELTSNIDYKKRAEYFSSLISKFNFNLNSSVLLDLGCGTGNMSFEFLKLGYDIIGIDLSVDMLNFASQKNIDNNILFINQDIRNFNLYDNVDIAVSCLDTLNHLDNIKDVKDCFKCVYLYLQDNGLFLFDVNSKYKHTDIICNNTFIYDMENVYVVWKNNLNEDFSINIELDIFDNISENKYLRYFENFKEIYISPDDIESICKNVGFEIVDVYCDDSFKKPCFESERIIYILRKVK